MTQDIQSNLLDILWCHKAASFDKGVRSGSQDQVDTCPGSGAKWDKGAQFPPVVVAGVAGGENQAESKKSGIFNELVLSPIKS